MALMLSSQTKDQTVAEAMRNLTSSPGGLSVESVLAMSNEELDGHICKVSGCVRCSAGEPNGREV